MTKTTKANKGMYTTEVQNGEYLTKFLVNGDEATNLSTGAVISLRELEKMIERAKSQSAWEIITDSNQLDGTEISDNAVIYQADVSYNIDSKVHKFEMDIAVEHDTQTIFIVKYNTETEVQHFRNFEELDNTVLSIVNNADSVMRQDTEELIDRDQLLSAFVACLEPEHEEIADDRPSFKTSKGVIFYDNRNESYRLQKLSLTMDKPKVKRQRLGVK